MPPDIATHASYCIGMYEAANDGLSWSKEAQASTGPRPSAAAQAIVESLHNERRIRMRRLQESILEQERETIAKLPEEKGKTRSMNLDFAGELGTRAFNEVAAACRARCETLPSPDERVVCVESCFGDELNGKHPLGAGLRLNCNELSRVPGPKPSD